MHTNAEKLQEFMEREYVSVRSSNGERIDVRIVDITGFLYQMDKGVLMLHEQKQTGIATWDEAQRVYDRVRKYHANAKGEDVPETKELRTELKDAELVKWVPVKASPTIATLAFCDALEAWSAEVKREVQSPAASTDDRITIPIEDENGNRLGVLKCKDVYPVEMKFPDEEKPATDPVAVDINMTVTPLTSEAKAHINTVIGAALEQHAKDTESMIVDAIGRGDTTVVIPAIGMIPASHIELKIDADDFTFRKCCHTQVREEHDPGCFTLGTDDDNPPPTTIDTQSVTPDP